MTHFIWALRAFLWGFFHSWATPSTHRRRAEWAAKKEMEP